MKELFETVQSADDTIKADPAITAKILKASNSSFFGLRSECKGIERAVPLLGTMVVTSLALESLCRRHLHCAKPQKSHRFETRQRQKRQSR